MSQFKVGDKVRVHPDYARTNDHRIATWEIVKVNPVNLKVKHTVTGGLMNVAPECLVMADGPFEAGIDRDGQQVFHDTNGYRYIFRDGMGWLITSCCDAVVTFSGDGYLCCKGCWEVQDMYLAGLPDLPEGHPHYRKPYVWNRS